MRLIAVIVIVVFTVATGFMTHAEGIPQYGPNGQQPPVQRMMQNQEKMVEAYVPPPPIRHSWPGGYRVLLHEIMNTLMDHMTGHY